MDARKNRKRAREYYYEHADVVKARASSWNRANPKRRRDIILKNRYCKIRAGQYDELMQEQKGMCAICKRAATGRSLEVDHDHATNEIRGLLCHRCNVGIGFLSDSVALLQGAIEYLERK